MLKIKRRIWLKRTNLDGHLQKAGQSRSSFAKCWPIQMIVCKKLQKAAATTTMTTATTTTTGVNEGGHQGDRGDGTEGGEEGKGEGGGGERGVE